jgi:thiamine transport system permease protein
MTKRQTIPSASSVLALLPAVAVAVGLLPLVGYAIQQGGMANFDAYIWGVLRFTLMQATFSTLLSVVPAIPISRALVRREFAGKQALLALFAVPLSLPVIVAVLGITQVYGNAGWLGGAFNFYGLTGILIAHVFFNLPLAIRLLYEAQQSIPAEAHRLAAQLNLRGVSFFRTVEWPFLKPAIASTSALIFLLCAASFVIVLTLGGGPAASTLEVAIYQSLRLDFDLTRAVTLAVLQVALCVLLVVLIGNTPINLSTSPLRLTATRYDGTDTSSKVADILWIVAAAIIMLPPLIAIITAGLSGFQYSPLLPAAVATSLGLGLVAALTTTTLAWPLASHATRATSLIALAGLIVPPAVIATGWFIAFQGWNGGTSQAIIMIVALNALMALPFAVSVLRPALTRHADAHDRLCSQLDLAGLTRFRLIDYPALKRPLLQALLMAFALSLGDLTAVTLLGSQGLITLPSLISQQMGNYRSAAAGGTALLLAALCYILTLTAQRIGRA